MNAAPFKRIVKSLPAAHLTTTVWKELGSREKEKGAEGHINKLFVEPTFN